MIYIVKADTITVRKDHSIEKLYFFHDSKGNIFPTNVYNIILDDVGYAISTDKNLFEEIQYNLFGNFVGKLKYNIFCNDFIEYFYSVNQLMLPLATNFYRNEKSYFGNNSLIIVRDIIYLKHNIGNIKGLIDILNYEELKEREMNKFAAKVFGIGFRVKNEIGTKKESTLSSLAKDSSKKYLPAKIVGGKVYARINGKWVKFFSNYRLAEIKDYSTQIWVQKVKYHYHRYFIKIQSKNNSLPIKTVYGSKFEITKDLTQNQTKIAEQIISILGED